MLRLTLICLCLVGFSSTSWANGQEMPDHWEPAKTWVFMVGLLEWKSPDFHPFPQKKRRDERLLTVLRQRGVPESQITYLKDNVATTEHTQQEFEKFLKKPAEGDWVFFYFAGHGFNSKDHTKTFLATYDAGDGVPGWSVAPIAKGIGRRCKASYAMIAVDNCCSGGMAEAVKNLKEPRPAIGVFASAHWNSGSTANWTFTENLIYAFSGENFMDDNSDGTVTFSELRANTYADMTFAEHQMPQFTTTDDFNPKCVLAKDKANADPAIGERAEFLSQGKWYPGFTVARSGDLRKVRYYGYDSNDDEWVKPEQTRHPQATLWPVGQHVEALSQKEWYPGKIVAARDGLHLIKFDDWESEWNEWLPARKLRPKSK